MAWRRLAACLLTIGGVAFAWSAAAADDIDSEHLFGFTEGTDIGEKGDKELELEGHGRFGARQGTYTAVSTRIEGKFTIFDNFRIAPGFGMAHHKISGVPGLDDRKSGAFEGLSLEMKYRLLDRQRSPFGLTVAITPSWARVAKASGEPVDSYGIGFLLSADKDLVSGKLFAALNMTYDPASTRSRAIGEWSRNSSFGLSGAVAMKVFGGAFVGGEARYARAYEGLAIDHFSGHALFIGPTFYAKLSKSAWIAAGWNAQVTGRAVNEQAALDLANFQRHEVKVRFGHAF